jgi:hypothetical protein
MERIPQPKARLVINIMDHGTIVGTDDPVSLEFEDCVNAVDGLIDWLARALAEVNDTGAEKIGSDILVAALHNWTFNEHDDVSDDPIDPANSDYED